MDDFIILLGVIMIFAGIYIVRRTLKEINPGYAGTNNSKEIESLILELSKNHKDRTEQLVSEHAFRLQHGADETESYNRMVGSLKLLLGEDHG